jgi:hypothetical protein
MRIVFLAEQFGISAKWLVCPYLKRLMLMEVHMHGEDQLKTHYTTHLAAGLGNVSTIEGVTCILRRHRLWKLSDQRRQDFSITGAGIRHETIEAELV